MTDLRRELTTRQRELLAGAKRLLDRHGLNQFTMRALADEVGLSPMAAYKHFDNQRHLQVELWLDTMNDLIEELEGKANQSEPGAEAFETLSRAFMSFCLEQPNRFDLLFNNEFVREVRAEDDSEPIRLRLWHYTRIHAEKAQQTGQFRDDISVEELLSFSYATLHGLAYVLVSNRIDQLSEVAAKHAMETSLRLLHETLSSKA